MSDTDLDMSDPAVCHQLGRETAQKEHQYTYQGLGTNEQAAECACGMQFSGPLAGDSMAAHVEREAVVRGATERDACLKRIGQWSDG